MEYPEDLPQPTAHGQQWPIVPTMGRDRIIKQHIEQTEKELESEQK